MRIISGDNKGLKLASIKGDWIRPTSDKIRGAIFSSLLSLLEDFNVFVDCFAGSGAMSIEAISRGFETAYLFDNNKKSIQIIKTNIDKANIENRVHVLNSSALAGLKYLKENKIKGDFFFMDPPYKKLDLALDCIEYISKEDVLSPGGIIMLEHDKSDIINHVINDFEVVKEKSYGNTTITTFKKK